MVYGFKTKLEIKQSANDHKFGHVYWIQSLTPTMFLNNYIQIYFKFLGISFYVWFLFLDRFPIFSFFIPRPKTKIKH